MSCAADCSRGSCSRPGTIKARPHFHTSLEEGRRIESYSERRAATGIGKEWCQTTCAQAAVDVEGLLGWGAESIGKSLVHASCNWSFRQTQQLQSQRHRVSVESRQCGRGESGRKWPQACRRTPCAALYDLRQEHEASKTERDTKRKRGFPCIECCRCWRCLPCSGCTAGLASQLYVCLATAALPTT